MHSLLDLNLATGLHRVRSGERPRTTGAEEGRRVSERPARPALTSGVPGSRAV